MAAMTKSVYELGKPRCFWPALMPVGRIEGGDRERRHAGGRERRLDAGDLPGEDCAHRRRPVAEPSSSLRSRSSSGSLEQPQARVGELQLDAAGALERLLEADSRDRGAERARVVDARRG